MFRMRVVFNVSVGFVSMFSLGSFQCFGWEFVLMF